MPTITVHKNSELQPVSEEGKNSSDSDKDEDEDDEIEDMINDVAGADFDNETSVNASSNFK